jgi:1,4-dihydroxy-2-naphthoate octaprenyltransferase/chlorophyll synthase
MRAPPTGADTGATSLSRWIYALKPASWPKLIVPAFFGQVLGLRGGEGLHLPALGWGLAFTFLGLGFIVLINDWGDRHVDALKREMFPDACSPKTIPDRILDAASVGLAGAFFAGATLLVAAGAEVVLHRPDAFEAGLLCMLIFVMYSLPPVRLNYRGGGEVLEMLGVGLALPLYNAYLQGGPIASSAWPWLAGFAVLSLAGGIASGLSDEESDRAGGKRTVATAWGNAAARGWCEAFVLIGAGIWVTASILWPDWVPFWVVGPAVAIILWNFIAMRKVSDTAVTNAFRAQSAYKRFLHRAIWHSTTVVAVLLWLRPSLA